MENKIIDGVKIANNLLKQLEQEIVKFKKQHNKDISLAIIVIGNSPASELYVAGKIKKAKSIGIKTRLIKKSDNITEKELISIIDSLNKDDLISGIIVQMPMPEHINNNKILSRINPNKDVDGFNPINVGKLNNNYLNNEEIDFFVPCTALGCLTLIKTKIKNLAGLNIAILGKSNIVGRPLISLLLNENSTVTVCNSKTKNIDHFTKQADIIISATGSAHLIKKDFIKQNSLVIDVGISRIEQNGKSKILGDVEFNQVIKNAQYITPVPGGVGPMTIAYLMHNCLLAAKKQIN